MTILPRHKLCKFRSATVSRRRRVGVRYERAGRREVAACLGSRGVVDGIAGRSDDDALAPVSGTFFPYFCGFFRRLV
jgi:hypothetical protein